MDAGQREMPEREPHVPAELLFDSLDRVEGLPRVRALVIAVLDNQMTGGEPRHDRPSGPAAPGSAGGRPALRWSHGHLLARVQVGPALS